MTAPCPPPQRLLLDRPWTCAWLVAASLLLSWWAVALDPVINDGGVDTLRAAEHFAAGKWRAAVDAAAVPFHALLVALVGGLPGLSAAQGAYLLAAVFHALLAPGFVALAAALGGDRGVQGLAGLLVLLFPALNALRPDVLPDPAYWACYLWALAWLAHFAATGQRRSAAAAAAAGVAALLFGLEAMLFLLVAPLWLAVRGRTGHAPPRARLAVALLAVAALLGYTAWQQALQAGAPVSALLLHPLDHLAAGWHELVQGLGFRLEGAREEFLDRFSRGYGPAALLVVIVLLCGAGLVGALGPLYAGIVLVSLARGGVSANERAGSAWRLFASLALLGLLAPAVTRFTVEPRAAMTAALTLLAAAPFALERVRSEGPARVGLRRWLFPAVAALVLAAGVAGLDLRTGESHLREAGLWLRANAPAGDALYSNSRVVVHYSGLDGYRDNAPYTWRHAMNRVHREGLDDYDYLALAIDRADRHREAILRGYLGAAPVHVTANDRGDRVLIFRLD